MLSVISGEKKKKTNTTNTKHTVRNRLLLDSLNIKHNQSSVMNLLADVTVASDTTFTPVYIHLSVFMCVSWNLICMIGTLKYRGTCTKRRDLRKKYPNHLSSAVCVCVEGLPTKVFFFFSSHTGASLPPPQKKKTFFPVCTSAA